MARQRPFPHLPLVEDPAVQSSARLLWDRVAALHDGVGEEQAALIAGARAAEAIPALLRREQFLFGYDALGLPHRRGPSPPTTPETAQLTVINNGYYVRNGQPVLPIMCHYMEAFSRYTRNENQVTDELTAIKEAGYTGIRFLDVLNGQPYWVGREVNPINVTSNGVFVDKTTQYYAKLKNFVSLCKDLGLLVNWSRGDLIPYSVAQRAEHFANVGAIANEVLRLSPSLKGSMSISRTGSMRQLTAWKVSSRWSMYSPHRRGRLCSGLCRVLGQRRCRGR